MTPVFNADPEPNVLQVPNTLQGRPHEILHSPGAFREDLVNMPIRRAHRFKRLEDELGGHTVLKEVAHRVYEYFSRPSPTQWLKELFRNQSEVKAELVRMPPDSAPALSEHGGVAVLATGAHLGASPNGIPGCIRPLNGAVVAHRERESSTDAYTEQMFGYSASSRCQLPK